MYGYWSPTCGTNEKGSYRRMRCLCLFSKLGEGRELRVHSEKVVARPTGQTPERGTKSQPCMCMVKYVW